MESSIVTNPMDDKECNEVSNETNIVPNTMNNIDLITKSNCNPTNDDKDINTDSENCKYVEPDDSLFNSSCDTTKDDINTHNIGVDNTLTETNQIVSSDPDDASNISDAEGRKEGNKDNNNIENQTADNQTISENEVISINKIDFEKQELLLESNCDDTNLNTNEVDTELNDTNAGESNAKIDCEKEEVKSEDDETDKDLKANNINIDIKAEDENDLDIFTKFRFSGERKRKKTELYAAEESFVKNKKPPPKIPVKAKKDDNQCEICKLYFGNKKALFNHRWQQHKTEERDFKCMQCNFYCEDNKQLKDHKESHTDDIFMCNKCELAYTNHCDFWNHSINHLPMRKSYTCEECQRKLYDKKALKVHIKSHFHIYIKCGICNESILRTTMSEHKATHNEGIQCVECGKICKSQTEMRYHMNVHIGFKPYQCLYCGKGYITRSGRETHTKSAHFGIRMHRCLTCGHTTSQYDEFLEHRKTHGTKREFECNICHKKYLHRDYLKKHMRLHTGQNLLKCTQCPKAFISRTELRSHILHGHTRVANFKCEPCDLLFISKNDLLKHFKSLSHKRSQYAYDNKAKQAA